MSDDLAEQMISAGARKIVRQHYAKPRTMAPKGTATKTKRRGPKPEEAVSVAIRSAIRMACPSAFFWHTPNETGGSENVKMHLIARKQQGVVSGIPDLTVTWPGGGIAFLEVKAPGKEATTQQEHIHSVLRKQGHYVETVDNVDDALAALARAGAPVRVRGLTRATPVQPLAVR